MKKYLYLYIVILFTMLLISCTDTDNAVIEIPEIDVDASDFYPGDAGTTYTYESEIETDSTNVQSERNSTIESGKIINRTVYLKQTNVRTVSGVQAATETLFFRKDSKGVYFYVDSDALIELLDSLGVAESDVEISADAEIVLVSYPFTSQWSAFGVTIDSYKGLPLNVDIMALTASYEGEEDVLVEAVNETMTAKKIVYTFKIGLPDAYEQYLPDVPSVKAEATAWFVQDIGLVKTEGSSFIIGAISGGDIEVTDSSYSMAETLVDYDIVSND